MLAPNKAAEAILRGNFDEARERLKNGESLSGPYVQNNYSQIVNSILRAKAFDLIDVLINSGLVELDIYEYDSFDKSIFKNIAQNLQNDEVSLSFFAGLLQKVQNINDEVKNQTLLGYCMDEGADPAVIKCLIEAGCNTQYKNNAEQNFIYCVVSKNMMKKEKTIAYINLLVANGVDVNDKDITGATPLTLAAQRRKTELISVLLENGANPNEQDNTGNTAFYYAVAEQMDSELYDQLAATTTPNFDFVNRNGETLITKFICGMDESERELTLLIKLISDGADLRQTALYYGNQKSGMDWLAEKKSLVLKVALSTGAIDINEQDNNGNTLLHKVCAYNVNFDAEAAKETYRKVKMLIDNGADLTITNDKDETALMLASNDNLKIKTVELLMQKQ